MTRGCTANARRSTRTSARGTEFWICKQRAGFRCKRSNIIANILKRSCGQWRVTRSVEPFKDVSRHGERRQPCGALEPEHVEYPSDRLGDEVGKLQVHRMEQGRWPGNRELPQLLYSSHSLGLTASIYACSTLIHQSPLCRRFVHRIPMPTFVLLTEILLHCSYLLT